MQLSKLIFPLVLAAGSCVSTGAQASLAAGLPSQSYSTSSSWHAGGEQDVFNGGYWNAGAHGSHWIQVDLGQAFLLDSVNFIIDQMPDGITFQKVYVSNSYIGNDWVNLVAVASSSGFTTHGTYVELDFAPTQGRFVEILANGGPSWTALESVNVAGTAVPVPEPGTWSLMLAGLGGLGAVTRRRKLRDGAA